MGVALGDLPSPPSPLSLVKGIERCHPGKIFEILDGCIGEFYGILGTIMFVLQSQFRARQNKLFDRS